LDPSRVRQLISLVSGDEFGQIFITHTHGERLSEILEGNEEVKMFEISDGEIKEGAGSLTSTDGE